MSNTILTQEHADYLEELKESGKTNMFGAGIYIEREFCVNKREARKIVRAWMDTYDEQASITTRRGQHP